MAEQMGSAGKVAVDAGMFDAFDALDSVVSTDDTEAEGVRNEEPNEDDLEEVLPKKAPAKKPEKKEKEEEEEDDSDSEEDDEEEEDEEKDDEEEDKKEKRPIVNKAKEEEPQSTRKKPIKVKQGDEVVKLKPTSTISVQADGREEEVTIDELITSYSSKEARKREGAELVKTKRDLDRAQQQIKHEREEMQSYIKSFAERVKDPTKVIAAVAELLEPFSEEGPLATIRSIRKGLLTHAKDFLELSEEQQRVLDLEEELAWRKERDKKVAEKQKSSSQQQQLVVQVNKAIEAFGMGDVDVFEDTYHELQSLVKDGLVTLQTIAPPHVGGFYIVRETIREVAPSLLKDRDAVAKLMRAALATNPTREELVETIEAYAGSNSSKSKTGKLAKLSTQPKTEKPSGTKKGKLDDLFF